MLFVLFLFEKCSERYKWVGLLWICVSFDVKNSVVVTDVLVSPYIYTCKSILLSIFALLHAACSINTFHNIFYQKSVLDLIYLRVYLASDITIHETKRQSVLYPEILLVQRTLLWHSIENRLINGIYIHFFIFFYYKSQLKYFVLNMLSY